MVNLFMKKKVKELKLKAAKSKTSILSFWLTAFSPPTKKKKDNPSPCSTMQRQSDSSETEITKKTEVIEIGNTF